MRVALGGSLTRPKAALPPIIIGNEEAFLLRFVTMTQKTNNKVCECVFFILYSSRRVLCECGLPRHTRTQGWTSGTWQMCIICIK